jgi:hypothetical protein
VITDLTELAATVKTLMAPYTGTWALCGGWAVDMWLGRVTREHGDIDFAVFRHEQGLFFEQLADWRLVAHETDEADHNVLWDGHDLAFPSHLHADRQIEPVRELVVNERGEGSWILCAAPLVALPLARFAIPGPFRLPVVAPEAALYYKMLADRRPQDDLDITNLMPLLDEEQRSWLTQVTRR